MIKRCKRRRFISEEILMRGNVALCTFLLEVIFKPAADDERADKLIREVIAKAESFEKH